MSIINKTSKNDDIMPIIKLITVLSQAGILMEQKINLLEKRIKELEKRFKEE
ncbi:MAG: hypothetical protein Tp1111DCM1112741_32 [Prokaryotic dsDNA virus sp.]|nr:MAG: hypothetical protein Tp1111DCM1112741_32 [Prokaryotic dsDNA virus sp.]|tara:strand:- start:2759 stop:2914 length:156 start_codon:yes stop_codon:yes gene_type:complete